MIKRLALIACIAAVTTAHADRIDDLLAALSSEDPATRGSVYNNIATMEIETYHIPRFAALLDHENPEVVRAGKLALEGMVAPLTDAEGLREIAGETLCDAIDAVENDGWLFWLLSYVAEPNVSARVGGYFGSARFDDVVTALQGIGGENSAKALVKQLTKSAPEERIAIVTALGEIGGETAIAALLNQAAQPDPVGLAAIAALGNARAPRALPIIEARMDAGFSAPVFSAYAKILEVLPEDEAIAAYESLLKSENPAVQVAALTALAGTGNEAALRPMLSALYSDDPAIHGAARDGLATIENANATRVLEASLKSASPETKGVMLEILHARDPEIATPLLEAALNDRNPNIQLAAITILGRHPTPRYEKPFREAAKNGDATIRAAALNAYLALARSLEGESDRALNMYKDAFDFATTNDERRAALGGMGRTGKVTTLAALQYYEDIDGIGDDLAETALAIADRLAEERPNIAKRVYEGVALRGTAHLAQHAAENLRAMGDDRDFATEAGFISRWQIIGPFPNEGMDHAHPPETEFDETAEYEGANGKTVRWTNIRTPHIRGIVDLIGFMDPNQQTVAYARVEIEVERAGEAILKLGSDDGIAAWLNGKQVHKNDVDRGLAIDADEVPVTLIEGPNTLLLKITQRGGGWAFCARFVGPETVKNASARD